MSWRLSVVKLQATDDTRRKLYKTEAKIDIEKVLF
jgi:hypothetical protein